MDNQEEQMKQQEENPNDNEIKRLGRQFDLEKKLTELDGKKEIGDDGFEYWTLENPLKLLEKLMMDKEYAFHGSTRKLTELIPRQSNDDAKESGNRVAVYFTRNPLLAEFRALVGGTDEVGSRENSIGYSYETEGGDVQYHDVKLAVGDPKKMAKEGYVYISPVSGMEDINSEYLLYENRKPDIAIKIKREDLAYNIDKIDERK